MLQRPAIGQRVRVLGNTGIPGLAGKLGTVTAHHGDGIAFEVRVDGDKPGARPLTCDPINVRPGPANG